MGDMTLELVNVVFLLICIIKSQIKTMLSLPFFVLHGSATGATRT